MNYNRLIKLLQDRNISNAKLAAMCGISGAAIGKILAGGDMKVSSLEAIAKALDVPVDFFFGEERGDCTAIGYQSIAGSGNTISDNIKASGEVGSVIRINTQKAEEKNNPQQIIASQKDKIIELQNQVIDLQKKLLNAHKINH